MEKLTHDDLLSLRQYRQERDAWRRRIVEMKRKRRMAVGDKVTLVFENRDTVRFQVQEMLLAELITEREMVQQELEAYNPLIPEANELSATLLIEIPDQALVRQELDRLVGLHEYVWLKIGDEHKVHAWFEPGTYTEERIAAVQYIKFRLAPEEMEAFKRGQGEVAVVSGHPNYKVEGRMLEAVRETLARELGT
ncbi:MAG: DUF3501 family protein [Dehalococcoidia bacterium]